MSEISWTRQGDEPYEAQVDVCVRVDGNINLSFSNKEAGFSGRLVLAARRGPQEVVGWWIWDQPRDDAVKGRFTTLNRERVVFEGSWYDKGDSKPWDFFFESPLSA